MMVPLQDKILSEQTESLLRNKDTSKEQKLEGPHSIIIKKRDVGNVVITHLLEATNLNNLKKIELDLNERLNESSFELLYSLLS